MASIGLGASNLWNMRGVNTNLTKKTAPEENQNKDEAVKTPILDTGTPIADLPRVPAGTLLANNGVKINTAEKTPPHFDDIDKLGDAYAEGKLPPGTQGTVGNQQFIVDANGDLTVYEK